MKLDGMNVFLSGPMSGYANWNADAFVKAHIALKEHHAEEVYDPFLQWLSEPDSVSSSRDHESYMVECLHELTRMDPCGKPHYNLLVQLDGWRESEGAVAEHAAALACGIMTMPLSRITGEPATMHARVAGGGSGGSDGDGACDACDGCDADDANGADGASGACDAGIARNGNDNGADATGSDAGSPGRERDKCSQAVEKAIAEAVIAACSQHGIDPSAIVHMETEIEHSEGMNAFEDEVSCRVSIAGGRVATMHLAVAGPAIPDRGKPLADQIEAYDLVWEGIV
jgi:hypothetical protein